MAEQALAIKAPPQPAQRLAALFSANVVDLIVPIAILAIIIALITPMPALLLDFLLATDIMLSIVVLMVSVYMTQPVEFTVLLNQISWSRRL